MARDPELAELFERAYRQIEASNAKAAARHAVVVESLEAAERRRDRIGRQYAELESTVTAATERFVRSERIFVEALSEMAIDMRRTRERLDRIGDDTSAHRETLLAILDRMDELRS